MFGWPIWLTARASMTKRSTAVRSVHRLRAMTLMAAFFPMSGWWAAYTHPIPPSPILPSTTYSPTGWPVGSSSDSISRRLTANHCSLFRFGLRQGPAQVDRDLAGFPSRHGHLLAHLAVAGRAHVDDVEPHPAQGHQGGP